MATRSSTRTATRPAAAKAAAAAPAERIDPTLLPAGPAAVLAATGKTWEQWFALLDAAGVAAQRLDHTRAWQATLALMPGSDGWWAQMVSVGYERVRGLRALHQSCNGEFQASVSRTLPVPLAQAYAAFAEQAALWLAAPDLAYTKLNRDKNIRARWPDGSRVDLRFTAKGPARCQVVADTTKLEDAAGVAAAKAFWQARFARLSDFLGLGAPAG